MYATLLISLLVASPAAEAPLKPKKLVLLAGKKSHGPVGNGIHDYGWSVQLLQAMFHNSNIKDRVKVEIHLNGWPRDPRTLEDADSILIVSDGRDGHLFEEAPHLASPERVRFLDQQMKRGCGFATFHFSTFAPNQYAEQMLRWSGAFFQWETNGERKWYSSITTKEAAISLGTPEHPVSRGLTPFTMREEFYYNLRFKDDDPATKPIWIVPSLGGRKDRGNVVAWVREREDGGRGFGTTCGHFYDNWRHDNFRKMMLNALAWTAKVEIPPDGVEARFFTHADIRDPKLQQQVRVLLVSGNEAHKWHNWEKSTQRLQAALEQDTCLRVDVVTDFDELAKRDLSNYSVILLNNWCNWHDPRGPSDKSKQAFAQFVREGGGLILVHFANGAFHPSLPMAGASDWPEYRKIVRRVWNHQKRGDRPPSGHDAFGRFTVLVTKAKHPLTMGLKRFEIEDELYFGQDGDEAIEPLLVAESKVTKKLEPLAWTYHYGKGRVFQTLLGHSEKTWDAVELCELLRRAVRWTAGAPLP